MSETVRDRPAGWVHHPGRAVVSPLDVSMDVPVPSAPEPATLHFVFTTDGLYVPAVSRRPTGRGPFPVVIMLHGGSGGLGASYLVDHAVNQAWAVEALIARGYAVVLAEGRMEHEDAYGTGAPFVLDHTDVIGVLRFVARQPWADPDRIGFFGVSHGGELQMKLVAELTREPRSVMPSALVMCEPAVVEFLGLKYEGVRKEANLQFNGPVADAQIDVAAAGRRIARLPDDLPMLVVGRDEDHLQGLFAKLFDLLERSGKRAQWASFSYPEHAYQFGPRRGASGYAPDEEHRATLELVMAFLDAHVRTKGRQ